MCTLLSHTPIHFLFLFKKRCGLCALSGLESLLLASQLHLDGKSPGTCINNTLIKTKLVSIKLTLCTDYRCVIFSELLRWDSWLSLPSDGANLVGPRSPPCRTAMVLSYTRTDKLDTGFREGLSCSLEATRFPICSKSVECSVSLNATKF